MEKDLDANLNKIKKVIATSDIPQVNRLLNDGWKILEIQKKASCDPRENDEIVFYHLGHEDPKASKHEREYTKPEDL